MDYSDLRSEVIAGVIVFVIIALFKATYTGLKYLVKGKKNRKSDQTIEPHTNPVLKDTSEKATAKPHGFLRRMFIWIFKFILKLSIAFGIALFVASYIDSELHSVQFGTNDIQQVAVLVCGFLAFLLTWKITPIKLR